MGILADSAIVGAATFLVGSVLMGLSIKQEGKDVKWWPYVGTFIAGSLGFYLVAVNDVIEVKDAESKECPLCDESYDAVDDKWGDPLCECLCQFCFDAKPTDTVRGEWVCTTCKKEHDNEPEDWMAESDEAEAKCKYCELNDPENCMYYGPTCLDAESFSAEGRKIRRRSRLAWTKGFDPAHTSFNDDGVVYLDFNTVGYNLPHNVSNREEYAYYINDLPEGYYIHLYRPRSRSGYWQAWGKSPKDTEVKHFYSHQKSMMTQQILNWYNTVAAKPENSKDLTPIQKMMQQHGMLTNEPTIARTVIKGYDRKKFVNGKQRVIRKIPTEHQWYAFGGPDKLPMHKIASLKENQLEIFPKEEIKGTYAFADNFLRGLVFLDTKRVGKDSSVAKYNKDAKKWVSLYPAWFQNACEHDVKDLRFEEKYGDEYQINGHTFLEFNERGRTQGDGFEVKISFEQPHKVSKTIQNKMWKQAGDEWQKQNGPTTATQSMSIAHWSIFAQCVAKYQPQKNDLFTRSLNTWGPTEFAGSPWGRVMKVGQRKYMDSAAHIFLRRLGKKK